MAQRERKKREFETALESPQMTSMIDVSFLILIFFMLLPFRQLAFKLEAHLPVSRGIDPRSDDPVDHEVLLRIRGLEVAEVTRHGWPRLVPGAAEYRLGERSTRDLKRVEAWLRTQVAAASSSGFRPTEIVGKLRAGPDVPFKFVVAAMDKFMLAGFKTVDFRGSSLNELERVRDLVRLPWPRPAAARR